MRKSLTILSLLLLLAGPAAASTITIINGDSAGEGFNDPTPAAPVGGNPGTTVGQQRLNLFQHAADIWGGLLPSNVEIRVLATFDPLTCDAGSAVLGSAGPIEVERDFAGAEWAGTWYHIALANRQAGVDLSPAENDIRARFNSSIDNNEACLAGTNWYYGFDGNEGGDVELLPVLLHEMGHGLGFSTLVSGSTGQEFLGDPDVYETFIYDNGVGLHWDEMTNGQRAASAIGGDIVWDGFASTVAAPLFLGGTPIMEINSPGTLPSPNPIGTAAFGPQVDEIGITGDLVLVEDDTAPTSDACTAIVNGAQVAGNIALIDRGTCTFVSKALQAQAVGAIAVVIVNNVVADDPPALGGTDPSVAIPVVSITKALGDLIKAELGGGVNVTLRLDPSQLAGTDANGRVKLYAPNPLESGSSVSHWDVSATPSLLMEPAITSILSSDVDLTLKHFEDIGWLDERLTATPEMATARLGLRPNYPNPFNPATTIAFELDVEGPVRLEIYDLAGRLVRRLVDKEMTAGPHSVQWNGLDAADRSVASGVYLYRLSTSSGEETRRMVLLK